MAGGAAERAQRLAPAVFDDAKHHVFDAIDGLLMMEPGLCRLDGFSDSIRVVVRRDWLNDGAGHGLVGLVSGGGAGHEPAHAGFVGQGMLTAAVVGDVFASPSVDAVLAAIRTVCRSNDGAGCLLIVKNYTGDRLNFGMAAEQAKLEGHKVEMVVVADDVALPGNTLPGRRGVAGTVLVHKLAGAAAQEGLSLQEVASVARQAASHVVSVGLALSTCSRPGGQLDSRLAPGSGQVELGLGIHGEPGARRLAQASASAMVDWCAEMMRSEVSDRWAAARGTPSSPKASAAVAAEEGAGGEGPVDGPRLVLLVNNLGGLSGLEECVVARHAVATLSGMAPLPSAGGDHARPGVARGGGVQVPPSTGSVSRLVTGRLMTALDMKGFSLSALVVVDPRWEGWLDQPVACAAWPARVAKEPWRSLAATSTVPVPADTPAVAAAQPGGSSALLPEPVAGPEPAAAAAAALALSVLHAAARVTWSVPLLTRLDTIAGDGDCGTTMKAGAEAVADMLGDVVAAASERLEVAAAAAAASRAIQAVANEKIRGHGAVALDLIALATRCVRRQQHAAPSANSSAPVAAALLAPRPFLSLLGRRLCRHMGGSSGAVLGILLEAAARHDDLVGVAWADCQPSMIGAALVAGAEAVTQYGGATQGDKTLLDAVLPMAAQFTKLPPVGEPDDAFFASLAAVAGRCGVAAAAAWKGARSTRALRAQAGRSGYVGDKSIGWIDAGAAAVAAAAIGAAEGVQAASALRQEPPLPTPEPEGEAPVPATGQQLLAKAIGSIATEVGESEDALAEGRSLELEPPPLVASKPTSLSLASEGAFEFEAAGFNGPEDEEKDADPSRKGCLLLGKGGDGVVYGAVEVATGRQLAVKEVLKNEGTVEQQAGLRDEATALRCLAGGAHPNIVQFRGFFEDDERCMLVESRVEGPELFDVLGKLATYSERDARKVFGQLCSAISYCHERGVVYRDVKPENILLASENPGSDVTLCDFGFAKVFDPAKRPPGRLPSQGGPAFSTPCGTPMYVSPELLASKPYGVTTDVWSLGVVLFILLLGYPPFYADNDKKLFQLIRAGKYSADPGDWAAVSESARDLIGRLLVVDPAQRITAREALRHPWLRQVGRGIELQTAQRRLRRYNARRKLRRALHTVKATVMLRLMLRRTAEAAAAAGGGAAGK